MTQTLYARKNKIKIRNKKQKEKDKGVGKILKGKREVFQLLKEKNPANLHLYTQ
jgi:hypothetical protein